MQNLSLTAIVSLIKDNNPNRIGFEHTFSLIYLELLYIYIHFIVKIFSKYSAILPLVYTHFIIYCAQHFQYIRYYLIKKGLLKWQCLGLNLCLKWH